MKKAAKLIRTDPSLSAQVLRMCNSPMFGLRSRVIGIEQAANLLGADRLRTIALTTSLVDFAGQGLQRRRPGLSSYAAVYPAHTFPCQRFDAALANSPA